MRQLTVLLTLTLPLALSSGCGRKPSPGPPQPANAQPAAPAGVVEHHLAFADLTKQAGVDFRYQSGHDQQRHTLLQWLGGGVALIDYDLDGALDLFFPGGGGFAGDRIFGSPPALYRQGRPWRFADVGAAARTVADERYTHGCEVADFNNDGFPDMLVTGYGGVQLFQNLGDGTFQEVAAPAGLHDDAWSTGAAWGDVNGDGALDLYVTHYVNWSFANHPVCTFTDEKIRDACPPQQFEAISDILYVGVGDGSFREADESAGLLPGGKGLGVLLADIDQDSDVDIYVANDTTDNFLYLNDGGGTFVESALANGVAGSHLGAPDGSMGIDLGDYDQDGKLDIWVTNFFGESFAMYRNLGDGLFQHASRTAGVNVLGGMYIGFGTVLADFDQDGDEDLMVANGHIQSYPHTAPVRLLPLMMRNDDGRYSLLAFPEDDYFATPRIGRGVGAGDLDNDGDTDLVVTHIHDPPAVLRNDNDHAGRWVRLKLIGLSDNRDAIGAAAVLHTSHGDQLRTVQGGGSYLSHGDNRILWGLPGGATVDGLTIRWPSGQQEQVKDVSPGETTIRFEPGNPQRKQRTEEFSDESGEWRAPPTNQPQAVRPG